MELDSRQKNAHAQDGAVAHLRVENEEFHDVILKQEAQIERLNAECVSLHKQIHDLKESGDH